MILLFHQLPIIIVRYFRSEIGTFSICLHTIALSAMDMCSPITKFTEEGHSEYLFSFGE